MGYALLIASFVVFVLSFTTHWWPSSPGNPNPPYHWSLLSLGLALYVLSLIVPK